MDIGRQALSHTVPHTLDRFLIAQLIVHPITCVVSPLPPTAHNNEIMVFGYFERLDLRSRDHHIRVASVSGFLRLHISESPAYGQPPWQDTLRSYDDLFLGERVTRALRGGGRSSELLSSGLLVDLSTRFYNAFALGFVCGLVIASEREDALASVAREQGTRIPHVRHIAHIAHNEHNQRTRPTLINNA